VLFLKAEKKSKSPNERCSLTLLKVICEIAGTELPAILSYLGLLEPGVLKWGIMKEETPKQVHELRDLTVKGIVQLLENMEVIALAVS
jgi:hypothetical protein